MSEQPNIGWCHCCNKAVIEIPEGTCSNCFNHTMQVMSMYDHQKQLSAITAERDALRIENERLCDTRKLCIEIDALKSQLRFAEEDIDKLRVKTFARFHNEDCWIFQGDGEDHLESLTCPVVISPEELQALLALKARIEEAEPVARVQIVDGRVYVTSEPSMVSLKKCGHDAPLYAIPQDTQELIRKAVEDELEACA